MKGLIDLLKLIYGSKIMSRTLGTRTNVIRLPDNNLRRYIKEDLNIEAASDELAKKAYKDMEQLIPEVPRMNDAQRLIFEGNLRRLANKLKIRQEWKPTAEVFEFGTKEKVTPKGIETLTEQAGQKSPPGTVMGNIESRINKIKASGKELGDVAKEEGGMDFGKIMDDYAKQQEKFLKIQNSGLVTSTAREILQRDIKAGKLKLPKEIEDRIMLVDGNPGTVNPVEVFRTNYGEDALEQVDSLIPELAKAQSYSDLIKIVEKKYPMKPLAKPRKETMDLDEAAKAEQENILTPKKPEEPEEFATGGRVGFMDGGSKGLDYLTGIERRGYADGSLYLPYNNFLDLLGGWNSGTYNEEGQYIPLNYQMYIRPEQDIFDIYNRPDYQPNAEQLYQRYLGQTPNEDFLNYINSFKDNIPTEDFSDYLNGFTPNWSPGDLAPEGYEIVSGAGDTWIEPSNNVLDQWKAHAEATQAMKGETGLDAIPEYGFQTGYDFQSKFPNLDPRIGAGLASGYQVLTEGLGMFNPNNPNFLNPAAAYKTALSDATKNIEGIMAFDQNLMTPQQQENRNKYLKSVGQDIIQQRFPTYQQDLENYRQRQAAVDPNQVRQNYLQNLQNTGTTNVGEFQSKLQSNLMSNPNLANGGRIGFATGSTNPFYSTYSGIPINMNILPSSANNPFYPSFFESDTFQKYISYLNQLESKDPLSSEVLYSQPNTYVASSGDGGNDDDSQTSTTSGSGTSIGNAISNAISSMTTPQGIGSIIGGLAFGLPGALAGRAIGASFGGGDTAAPSGVDQGMGPGGCNPGSTADQGVGPGGCSMGGGDGGNGGDGAGAGGGDAGTGPGGCSYATGGIVKRTGFKFGTKFGRFWKIARKVWDDINPTGDRKYDAQLVADELAEEIFKTSMDDLPQKVQIDLYALAYNNAPKVDALFKNPQSLSEAAKKGMAASKEMESLGLDVSKSSDFFKYEEMKLSGQLGLEHQVQAYKDKIRDEFYGVIDDTLMKQVEVDDNPQRLAEIYASIKEGLTMQEKGMTPEEIIRVMKQTPRTKNADGGLNYLLGF
jgi:hypothetical protein